MSDGHHGALLDDLARRRGVIMLVGGPDTGKSTLARDLLAAVVAAGKTGAYVDADIDQSTVGPPTCVGLKYVRDQRDLSHLAEADELHFVGAVAPDGVILQQVVATAALVDAARHAVDLIVVDTTGSISGVSGQTLKYHKMELCRPDVVIGLQRGAELEPLVGMFRRFFSVDVETAEVDPEVRLVDPEVRRAHRAKAFGAAFAEPLRAGGYAAPSSPPRSPRASTSPDFTKFSSAYRMGPAPAWGSAFSSTRMGSCASSPIRATGCAAFASVLCASTSTPSTSTGCGWAK
jgi:hypothetical protein